MGLQLQGHLAGGYHLNMRCTEAVQVLAAVFRFCSDSPPLKDRPSVSPEVEASLRCGLTQPDYSLIFW
jgi:hypothetical protein